MAWNSGIVSQLSRWEELGSLGRFDVKAASFDEGRASVGGMNAMVIHMAVRGSVAA
jgi:hypothetical protein